MDIRYNHNFSVTVDFNNKYDRLRSASGLKSASTDVIISNHGSI